jgi:hypothetical protein
MVPELTEANKLRMNSVSQSAFNVALGGFLSLIAAFASQMVIASFLGAGAKMDAFLTELGLLSYLQAVLLRGASFVYIVARDLLTGTYYYVTSVFRLDRQKVISLLRIVGVEQVLGGTRPARQPGARMLLR